MSHPELERLLALVESDQASEADLERLAMLMAESEGDLEPLPFPAPEIDFADAIMAAVMAPEADAEVGREIEPAVRTEAGSVELAAALAPLESADELPRAVRAEAGEIDLAAELAHWSLSSLLSLAVREEAGTIDLAAELAPVAQTDVLAAAVRDEAGTVSVVEQVALATSPEALSALLDRELPMGVHAQVARQLMADRQASLQLTAWADLGARLRRELAEEAGEVGYVWGEVGNAIGLRDPEQVEGYDALLVAAAVRAEAGTVDLAREVQTAVRHEQVLAAPVVELEELEPANSNLWRVVPGLVAAALVMLTLLQVTQPFGADPQGTLPSTPVQYASASDIVIDDLSGSGTVEVFMSDDQAVVIWVDEEAL